ncbi:MAG TPA: hypothetical protein VF623_01695 [Segetibacter sp.]|jgi:hypothetical protein
MSISQTIKTTLTTKTITLSAATFLTLCSAASANAQKSNFSGDWKLNEQKSSLGQYAQMAPRKLKVDGQADYLSVERFAKSPDGSDVSYNDKLTFDGKESESTLFGNTKKKSTAKWSDDGKSLNVNAVIMFDRDGQTFEVKVAEVWKFVEDGKVLSVESTSTSQMGSNTMKLFYEKAS